MHRVQFLHLVQKRRGSFKWLIYRQVLWVGVALVGAGVTKRQEENNKTYNLSFELIDPDRHFLIRMLFF